MANQELKSPENETVLASEFDRHTVEANNRMDYHFKQIQSQGQALKSLKQKFKDYEKDYRRDIKYRVADFIMTVVLAFLILAELLTK